MKTTKKDFDYFKECCQKWIDFWGMYQYEYYYEHKKLNGSLASYEATYSGACCTITMSTKWQGEKTREKIDLCAFHEITELMLIPLRSKAFYMFSEQEVEHDTHEVIRRMENRIFKKRNN